MVTYRKVAELSQVNAAYIAGLIDGEGTVTLTRKPTREAHHTPSFTYPIYNRQALALLTQIQPYLRTYKVDRTAAILREYIALTPRNGKY